ncbi:MAG TPA: AAA family ATPase [Polyangia bacterium]|nr:AAA family ATPase [Polyangia bacterium]
MSQPPPPIRTSRELGEPARTQAYVPLRLVQQLGPRPETSLRFRGTAMVADISEYATLLEAFSRSGKEGVEGLWQVLGRAFASALELVDAYGGEVVYFAGDALVCYWPEADGDLDAAALAVTCARRLLRQRLTVTLDQGVEVPVRFHIGVGSGELWAARMGGWSGRWNLLFGGEAVRSAFAALRTAGPGRMAAAGTALQALTRMGRHGRVTPAGDFAALGAAPTGADEPGRLPTTAHLDLLPPAVEQRAEAEDAEWAAEWRRIDSLFLRLPDVDESRPNGPAAFRTVLSVTQETLDSASVTGRAVIDDRGLTLVWVAGEPLSAHPRDQSAGLRLAAALVTRLRRQGFRAEAGFASGVALCGALGSARRREIIALGTPMVMAARLMEQGGEGLLVHAADVPEDPAGLRVQPLPDVLLKGMVHSAPVCRVDGEGEVQPASQVVGRNAEITLFEALLDDLPGGKGGLCLIEGVAGMGKSVLLRELQRRASGRGVFVTVAQALDAERRVPYFAWRAVFRRFFGDLMNEEPAAPNNRLMDLIVQSGRDPLEAPLLNVVLPVDFPETSLTSDMKGDDRARITRDLLLALLQRRIEGPHVLAFEDVHLMDSASIALFGEIAARLSRVLFVATARPDTDSDGLIARLATVRIQLQPVSAAVVAEMARVTLHLQLSPHLAEQIRDKARGVALYVRAYLHNLRRALGSAANGPVDSLPEGVGDLLPAPDPVQGVLVKSFDGLSAPDNRVLKIASIIGERFSAQLVEAVLVGKSAALDVRRALETACRRGIVEPDAALPQTYRFAHALLQSTCYETIPLGHRRELHRRVGAALESDTETVPELSDEQLVTLAHHFSRAGEYGPTVRYAEAAAARANRQGAYREAMRLLDLCLQVKPPDGETPEAFDPRVRWHRLKAEVAGAGGDRAVRQSEAEAALARAGCRPLPKVGAGVVIGGSILWRAIAGPRPLQAWTLRSNAERSRELSRIYRQLAVAGYFSGNVPQTAYSTISALRHASRLGRSPELVDAMASMGTCLGIIGFAKAGRRYLEAATDMAAQIGSTAGLSFAYVATALFLVGQGEWERAELHAERCQEIALRGGDAGNWGNALALRFWTRHYQGDHAEADALAGQLMDAARAARNAQHQSWAARFRGLGQMRRGEWAAARDSLQEARTLFAEAAGQRRELRPTYELMPVLCDLGATLVALDRRAEGLALCEQALAELEKPRRPSGHALLEGYSSLATASLMIAGKDGGAAPGDLARRTLAALERYCRVFPIGRPRLALWQGRALSARKPQAALSAWQRGLQAAGELRMRHDESLLTQELAALTAPG